VPKEKDTNISRLEEAYAAFQSTHDGDHPAKIILNPRWEVEYLRQSPAARSWTKFNLADVEFSADEPDYRFEGRIDRYYPVTLPGGADPNKSPDQLLLLFKFVRSLGQRLKEYEWDRFVGIWSALYELDKSSDKHRAELLDWALAGASRQAEYERSIFIEKCAMMADGLLAAYPELGNPQSADVCVKIAANIRSLK
jgi:hypothetical protein